jgi:hypothetical protein
MPVPVMQIRIVGMRVHDRLVRVRMKMRLAPVPLEIVRMTMMAVVPMRMRVLLRFVRMPMLVALREMQP